MIVLTYVALAVFGLILGSFVNAFVWRLHEQQELTGKKSKATQEKLQKLSIMRGRSMCPNCEHVLAAKDLVPVLSWLSLMGRCRYCRKPVSRQYPVVELATAVLFALSYLWWPLAFHDFGLVSFVLWLVFLVGFMILAVYDIRWFLLPDKVVWPLVGLALVQVLVRVFFFDGGLSAIVEALYGVLIASGFFYGLYVVSKGKWIGGGDVKLGLVIGLLVGGPLASLFVLYVASILGTLVSLPMLLNKKMKRSSVIPFGPFLLVATIIVQLFGGHISDWLNKLIAG
jgi:prepilin signal peptidase PulO-like enzyme (type II secretory pathway)